MMIYSLKADPSLSSRTPRQGWGARRKTQGLSESQCTNYWCLQASPFSLQALAATLISSRKLESFFRSNYLMQRKICVITDIWCTLIKWTSPYLIKLWGPNQPLSSTHMSLAFSTPLSNEWTVKNILDIWGRANAQKIKTNKMNIKLILKKWNTQKYRNDTGNRRKAFLTNLSSSDR